MRKIDGQLDGLQLSRKSSPIPPSEEDLATDNLSNSPEPVEEHVRVLNQPKSLRLQAAIKALSTASTARILLHPSDILTLLREGSLLGSSSSKISDDNTGDDVEETELDWLLVSKATNQTYGLVLRLLLDQTIPLSEDIDYWNSVLGSYKYMALYSVQTSPIRVWTWAKEIYEEACQRQESIEDVGEEARNYANALSDRWRTFYGLLKDSVRQRTLTDIQSRFMAPVTISQLEIRSRRRQIRRIREMSGSSIGILVDEGMVLDADDGDSISSKARSDEKEEWKSVVSKSVSLMEAVLRSITSSETSLSDFEETIFSNVDDESHVAMDEEGQSTHQTQTAQIAIRLQQLLEAHIPDYVKAMKGARASNGRPSRLIRYWIPGLIVFFSSSTLLRFLLHRKAAILEWIQDSGNTARDFWYNWVVEPVKKIVGTIRHDKDSEIAIMSKDSLIGDQASLERMVTDFAVDNPEGGKPLTDDQIASIRAKVKEGDLTPVLRAYEKDLRKPFVGTIRGDLIRALLIQIQKTKVDVEVAIGGIDNLLKSQELVFGFVGITPSLLVCVAAYRWLGDVFSNRRGQSRGQEKGSLLKILRNIDRVLTAATPSNNGMLSYKERGMLLCEVHVLRERAATTLPRQAFHDFLDEVRELIELRSGIDRQLRIVERIRWAYAKYLY